jgi:hypothetical protein
VVALILFIHTSSSDYLLSRAPSIATPLSASSPPPWLLVGCSWGDTMQHRCQRVSAWSWVSAVSIPRQWDPGLCNRCVVGTVELATLVIGGRTRRLTIRGNIWQRIVTYRHC